MKKVLSCFLVGLIACLTLACSSKDSQDKKVIATINDYPLTLDEFQYELASEMELDKDCLLYTSPSPRDLSTSRMPSSA